VKRRSLFFAALSLSCARRPGSSVQEAEFGVFFGGQVQELKEIVKDLDPERQRVGFRLTFRGALVRALPIEWELALPALEKGGPRPARVGQLSAAPGATVLDIPLSFRPGDPFGSWHAKLKVDRDVVVDRDFTLVPPPPAPKAVSKPLAPRGPLTAQPGR